MIDRCRRAERMARLEQELANSNERRRAARLTELEGLRALDRFDEEERLR
jgi:hypothetical protein